MTLQKLGTLEQLLGCYLHQDWLDEFESDTAALHAIIESESKAQIAAGIDEIDALLAEDLSESDLRMVLISQIGCYFDPNSDGITYTQWLGRVRSAFLGVPSAADRPENHA